LDLSKLEMYELAYDKLPWYERALGCKIIIGGGDTDSLFLDVHGAVDLQKDMYPLMMQEGLLDTSNYPKSHRLYSNALNAKLGCVKDEFKGRICKEVVLLAPKCYSFQLLDDPVPKQACKGVPKGRLSHQDYMDRYRTKTELTRRVRRMQSFKHRIFNTNQIKIALSFFENKRGWVDDNISLPYGHYKLNTACDIENLCVGNADNNKRSKAAADHSRVLDMQEGSCSRSFL